MKTTQNTTFLSIVHLCNSANLCSIAAQNYHLFVINEHFIGFIHPLFLELIEKELPNHYAQFKMLDVESLSKPPPYKAFKSAVTVDSTISDCSELLSNFFDELFQALRKLIDQLEFDREKSKYTALLYPLREWRNEKYAVWSDPLKPSFHIHPLQAQNEEFSLLLFEIERAAVSLLGVTSYGIHVNGVIRPSSKYALPSNKSDLRNLESQVKQVLEEFEKIKDYRKYEWKMWIAKRSMTKSSYPGMLDQITAGGISSHHNPYSTLLKEGFEEAGLDPVFTCKVANLSGTITYFKQNYSSISPKIQYIYDIFLPEDFNPRPIDGEVSDFYLWTIDEVLKRIDDGEFKPNSALVIIDFCIRHGIIRPDNEPDYHKILYGLHRNLPFSAFYNV